MGLNCLLISTNQVMVPYPVYPLGVAHLIGALQANGHRASHYDILAHGGLAKLEEILRSAPPDLIGLSIRNLDTVDSTAPDAFLDKAVEVMDFVRKHSSAPVVLGGPAFSILPEEILALLGADYGVVGEGEVLLPQLADLIEQKKKPGEKILRSTPVANPWLPAVYDENTLDYYLGWGGMVNIQTKRGCPYRCAYCSYPSLEGNKYRLRDPEAVADEVMRVARDYKARYIFFTDSVFNDAQGHFRKIGQALIDAGNKTPWCAFFRPQNLERADLALLKAAGLSAMELGTDAASDTTLAAMNKGFTFADAIAANEAAIAEEIPCAHFVIMGGPDETSDTLTEGLANIEQLRSAVVFAFNGIRVLPGTAMYDRAVADGVMAADQSLVQPFFYFSPHITAHELDSRIKEAWKGRFDRVYPCSVMQNRVTHLHKKGHIGPMWDMLVRFS